MRWPFRRTRALDRRAAGIRVIATDLDGTLLDDTSIIPQRNLDAAGELRQFGIDVLLASGRTDGFIRAFARELGTTLPVVSLNGALVKASDGTLLSASWMDPDACELVTDIIRNYSGTSVTFFTPDGLLSQSFPLQLPNYLRAYPEEHRKIELIHEHYDRSVMMVATGSQAVVQEIGRELVRTFKATISRTSYQSRRGEDVHYLELRNAGVSKGSALKALLPHLGIRATELAAIGDFENDIEMCRLAGLSACMRNGIGELRDSVDFVTQKSNNDAGVAEFYDLIRTAHMQAS